ncbi:MAG: chorismate mutase [Acidobacteriota bacterium]|nr:chorismate mutase [Acidobacteriota bacterium]
MTDMQSFRTRIDALDTRIVALLAERLDICREVAIYKSREGIPMMQPDRIRQIKERFAAQAERHNLNPAFLDQLYDVIIGESCRLEDIIIDSMAEKAVV